MYLVSMSSNYCSTLVLGSIVLIMRLSGPGLLKDKLVIYYYVKSDIVGMNIFSAAIDLVTIYFVSLGSIVSCILRLLK